MIPVRYVASATLARTADAGAGVGLVLLAADRGAGPAVGGLLAACLTFPHLIGPLPARLLDRSADGRALLAGFFALYGVALAVSTLSFRSVPLLVSLLLVALAGLCGPILTGGLSSRLASLVPPDGLRRAQGVDAVTYGFGGTAGPALVALLATVTSPRTALLLLCVGSVTSAALVLGLPRADRSAPAASGASFLTVIGSIAANPGLRRATLTTMVVQLVTGSLVVLAVELSQSLGQGAHAGATLIAGFGLGNLVGSLAVAVRPLRGSPDVLLVRLSVLIALLVLLAGLAPAYWLALAGFAAAGLVSGPHFAATLAARSDYSPPGNTAQVFVTMSALKVGAQSLGTATAGLFGSGLFGGGGAGPFGAGGVRFAMVGGGLVVIAVMGILTLDRLSHPAVAVHGS